MMREKLIKMAYNQNIQMDKLDRKCIISFFQHWEIPKRPKNITELMKVFFTCCFTYAPLRKYLSSIFGSIPTPSMLPNCLSEIYSEKEFLNDQNWTPNKLHEIASKIQDRDQFDLKSNQFKPRMVAVILDGSREMEKYLEYGIDKFYQELDEINKSTGEEIWKYVSEFPKQIYNVGTALICDFLKDIGCDRFVKVDHHFKKEFPSLLGLNDCTKLNSKEHFILSQEISNMLKMSPFHLDHLLYQWGRYKKYENIIMGENKQMNDNIFGDDNAFDNYIIHDELKKEDNIKKNHTEKEYIVKNIERIVETEENCGIVIEGANVIYDGPYLDDNMHAVVNAEIRAKSGTKINIDFHIIGTAFDKDGKILTSAAEDFEAKNFFAITPLKLHLPVKEKPVKVRIYAQKGTSTII